MTFTLISETSSFAKGYIKNGVFYVEVVERSGYRYTVKRVMVKTKKA